MSHDTRVLLPLNVPSLTIGVDLGDRTSRTCELDAQGHCVHEATVPTTEAAMRRYFTARPRSRVVFETCTHSPWLARLVTALGHEVVVANPSAMFTRGARRRRNDVLDARFLARQGRADVALLHPIRHRSVEAQQDLAQLRARDQLVKARTMLINHVRGAVKAVGQRLRASSAESFAPRARAEVPAPLAPALTPLLDVLDTLTQQIRAADGALARLIATRYPVALHLQQPAGVGPLTALAYVLLIDDPTRFRRSRDAGAYFGLVPRLDESSTSMPQLRISKAGDALGRRLLVSAAQYILGPFGPSCDLRRHGQAIAQRGGTNAKKRAVVAVARKLAVLLHHLWVTGATYDPDYLGRRSA
jgi:transposase